MTDETSLGFACIEFSEQILGIHLMPWQRWLLVHALELLEDGTFRFRTIVVLVARQNGKSTLAQVLALFFMYVRQVALIIGTAQNLDIAEDVWQGAVEIAEDIPDLAEEIKQVIRVNGKKALTLRGGNRYKVQAANRRGGRGLSGDLVIMDELREHQSWDAWGAVTKTTLARPLAQIWALSNAGDATSVVLRHLRKQAHKALGDPDGINNEIGGPVEPSSDNADLMAEIEVLDDLGEVMSEAADSLGIFEWSAPLECDLRDLDGIAQANPSLGHGTITLRAILAALSSDPEWVYRTEVLCQWSDGSLEGPFPPGAWDAGQDASSSIPEPEPVEFGVDVSHNRSHSHIGVCGKRDDGDWHGEVVASRVGIDWVYDWFAQRASPESPMRVAAQGRGAPVGSILDRLRTIDGLEVVECTGSEIGIGTGLFYDSVSAHVDEAARDTPKLWHRPQPVLDVAAATAASRPLGDGAWGWDRAKSPTDVASLIAVNMAFWLATRTPEKPKVSAYDSGSTLTMLD